MKNILLLFFLSHLQFFDVNGAFLGARNHSSEQSKVITLNVKDFGAIGDGVTNDTEAINKAINSHDNAIVIFPKGKYIAGAITPNKNVIMKGEGMNLSILKCIDYLNSDFIDLGVNKRISFFDLAIDGNGKNQNQKPNYPQAVSIKFGSLKMNRCKVFSARNFAIYTYMAHDIEIIDCIIDQGIEKTNFYDCIQTRYTSNVKIINNVLIGGWSGIRCLSFSKNILIGNNVQHSAYMDVGITVACAVDVRILNNKTTNNKRSGIEVDLVYSSLIKNNIANNNQSHGILIAEYTPPLEENGFLNQRKIVGGIRYKGERCLVQGNECIGNYRHGIAINGMNKVKVVANKISNNNKMRLGYAGIGISDSEVNLQKNMLKNIGFQTKSIDRMP